MISVVIAILIVFEMVNPDAPVKLESDLLPFVLFMFLSAILWWVTVFFAKKQNGEKVE